MIPIECHVCPSWRAAFWYYHYFVNVNYDMIEKTLETHDIKIVVLKNGEEHHFMADQVYEHWCKGRTYTIEGTLYHSGVPEEVN